MSIEQSIRDMLLADPLANVSSYPISLGLRAQETALPAYTYEIRTVERADISGQWQADLEIRSIAETVDEALTLHGYLMPVVVPGTYTGIPITAAMFNGRTVDPPTVGEGDEREPAEVVASFTIIYTE
jgi:hypothetical protein